MSESKYEPSGDFYLDYKHLASGLKRGDPEAVAYYNKRAAEDGRPPWEDDDPISEDPGLAAAVGLFGVAIVMGAIFAFVHYVM